MLDRMNEAGIVDPDKMTSPLLKNLVSLGSFEITEGLPQYSEYVLASAFEHEASPCLAQLAELDKVQEGVEPYHTCSSIAPDEEKMEEVMRRHFASFLKPVLCIQSDFNFESGSIAIYQFNHPDSFTKIGTLTYPEGYSEDEEMVMIYQPE